MSKDDYMQCPKCGFNEFTVHAQRHVEAHIVVNGDDVEQVDSRGFETEWDNDSLCNCRNCGYSGDVDTFTRKPQAAVSELGDMDEVFDCFENTHMPVGGHYIEVGKNRNGAYQYTISHATDAPFIEESPEFEHLLDAFIHAFASMEQRLNQLHPDENNDAVEGPGLDKALANALFNRFCKLKGVDPVEERERITGQETTLGQLHSILSDMLEEGLNPDTPVRIRTNANNTQPKVSTVEDVWRGPQDIIYLDEPGVPF